jgi:hypothetical protein
VQAFNRENMFAAGFQRKLNDAGTTILSRDFTLASFFWSVGAHADEILFAASRILNMD